MQNYNRIPGNFASGALALVTGGTGVIGPHLIRLLLSRGYLVRALVRHRPPSGRLPEDVDLCLGDITNAQALEEAVTGTNVIFHLAAILHINDPAPTLQSEYQRINVEATRCVVAAARTGNVRRLVLFSTINVYGSSEAGLVYDEDSPACPNSLYAETKLQAESIALDGLPAVVLRLAAVYGPGMKGNYIRLLNALRKGHFFMIGDGCNRRTLVHIRDACQAAVLAAEHPDAVGHIYNVTDGQIHTLREIVTAICQALGKKPPRFRLPVSLVRPAFGLLEDGLRLLGVRSPIGRSTVNKMTEDLAVSGDRIQRELGFSPRYDLVTGWRESVEQMRAEELAEVR